MHIETWHLNDCHQLKESMVFPSIHHTNQPHRHDI